MRRIYDRRGNISSSDSGTNNTHARTNTDNRTMVLVASTSSTRSNESSSTTTIPFQFTLATLFFLGTIGAAFLGYLPKVSSFSLSSTSPSKPSIRKGSIVSSWLGVAAPAAETDAPAADADASTFSYLMAAQAGGNNSNRRRRKERIRNNDAFTENGTTKTIKTPSSEGLPDPLVSFDSVESVRLMESPTSDDDKTGTANVELVLRSESDGKSTSQIIDPKDLHQTSDFDLWMALRKHVVDVSASQISVVLGTNYFTSRDKLLQDKIKARSSGGSDKDSKTSEAILLEKESEEDAKPSVKSNSKACAWGIKMEPLAFAQYSDLVEATNDNDDDGDDEDSPRNYVKETGMYLLKHVDPQTKRTYVFGASPDGVVMEHHLKADTNKSDKDSTTSTTPQPSVGLLEIKSLWGRRHKKSLPVFDRCPSRFYDQIQGQMAICDMEWCDLMLFIPPGEGLSSGRRTTNAKKRKGKSAKKRKKQAAAAEALSKKNTRKAKGKNYSILRVKRDEIYWNETVLPALIEFCNEVVDGPAEAKAKKSHKIEEDEEKDESHNGE